MRRIVPIRTDSEARCAKMAQKRPLEARFRPSPPIDSPQGINDFRREKPSTGAKCQQTAAPASNYTRTTVALSLNFLTAPPAVALNFFPIGESHEADVSTLSAGQDFLLPAQ